MADEILVKYKVDASEFGKVGVAVNTVTAETKELQTQIKATFADKSIEAATKQLYEQGDVMGALVNKYGSATSALKAMEKELATMAALGQRGTASFTELANATAELKDTIGDTRGEIKKMASDTKVFDTMVQGARGVAAAFSVATGLAASFGDENKDLQKTLLKVQGAMAALQGVQELANIATEKGGIATKAYGVALTVVDKISKVTGLSMAASWALATAGITLVIAGVVALISYLNDATEGTNELTDAEKEQAKTEDEIFAQRMSNIEKAKKLELERNKLAATTKRGELLAELQFNKDIVESTGKRITAVTSLLNTFSDAERNTKAYTDANNQLLDTELQQVAAAQRVKAIEKELNDERGKRAKVEKTDNIESFRLPDQKKADFIVDKLEVKPREVVVEKVPTMEVDVKLKPLSPDEETMDTAMKANKAFFNKYTQVITSGIESVSKLTNAIFADELQKTEEKYNEQNAFLEERKKAELEAAGDNAAKKAQIEEKYAKRKADLDKKQAIERAKIERQQAIANKAFAIFNIGLSTAQAIMKALEQVPAGYAMAAIVGAMGAVEIAAVAAQPLPTIPKFEKGGAVLAGGRNDDGHLIGRSHREGGILIEAQGGEYIWDRQATAKHGDIIKAAHENRIEDLVMHKYVIPILKARTAATENSDSYDDIYLRRTIQQTSAKSAKFIVDGISSNMKESLYFANRYK